MDNRIRNVVVLLAPIAIVAAAWLAYLPALPGPFAMDDVKEIVENPSVRARSLAPGELLRAADVPSWLSPRRPAAYVSFALNYRLSGLDSRAFRAVNVGLLAACGLALFGWACLLLRHWLDRDRALLAAAGAALLWTVHPLQTNMTSYIVQRMTSLAILAYFLSFTAFLLVLRTGRKAWWAPVLLFAALAALSKEIAYVIPASFLLCWAALPGTAGERWASKPRVAAVALAAVAILLAAAGYLAQAGYAARDFTLGERLLTEARVLWWYLALFLWPSPSLLSLDPEFAISQGLLSPLQTLPSLLFHAGAVALALALWRRSRLASLLVLMYYLHHLIEGTVLPLEIAFEHRMCLPGAFLAVGAAVLLLALCGRLRGRAGRGALAFGAAVAVLATALGAATWARNTVWGSELALWQDTAAKAPGKARPHNNLGKVFFQAGNLAAAERAYARALQIDPGYGEALVNLGLVRFSRGDFAGALASMEEAGRRGFSDPELHYNRGLCLENLYRPADALAAYQRALDGYAGLRDARSRMAAILLRRGENARAQELAAAELALDPGHAGALSIMRRLQSDGRGR